jgi:hypothetical protein
MQNIRLYVLYGFALLMVIECWRTHDQNWWWTLVIVLLLEFFGLLWRAFFAFLEVYGEILRLLEQVRYNTGGALTHMEGLKEHRESGNSE